MHYTLSIRVCDAHNFIAYWAVLNSVTEFRNISNACKVGKKTNKRKI